MRTNKPYNGLFLTIEGGDGCGKSTLCDRLAQALEKKGHKVMKTREPGGCPLSEKIRNLLLHPTEKVAIGEKAELLLFLAARAQHVEECLMPALHEGNIVICERFNDSTIAYQGCARGLGKDYVEKMANMVVAEPDLTFLLDIDPEVATQRLQKVRIPDRIENENLPFHREVRRGYLYLADEYPDRIKVLDASLSIDELTNSALKLLESSIVTK